MPAPVETTRTEFHVGRQISTPHMLVNGVESMKHEQGSDRLEQGLDEERIALGIKQPWAELILRGIKTLEIRSQATNVRGRIYLYTSQKLAREDFALAATEKHGLSAEELPTGLIVGSVQLTACRPVCPEDAEAACVPAQLLTNRHAWILTQPERLDPPCPVRFLPYGVWFYPFRRLNQT